MPFVPQPNSISQTAETSSPRNSSDNEFAHVLACVLGNAQTTLLKEYSRLSAETQDHIRVTSQPQYPNLSTFHDRPVALVSEKSHQVAMECRTTGGQSQQTQTVAGQSHHVSFDAHAPESSFAVVSTADDVVGDLPSLKPKLSDLTGRKQPTSSHDSSRYADVLHNSSMSRSLIPRRLCHRAESSVRVNRFKSSGPGANMIKHWRSSSMEANLRDRVQVHLHFLTEAEHSTMLRFMGRVSGVAEFARHNPLLVFDTFMQLVIIINAVVIGISCDSLDWKGWIGVDACFACCFLFEFLFKVWYLGWREYACGSDSFWNLFEVILLILSVLEIFIAVVVENSNGFSGLFRVLRLVRLTKLFRVYRLPMFTDLIMMMNGTVGGLRTLCWSTILICFPLYVVAVILRATLGEEELSTQSANHGIVGSAESFTTLAGSFFCVFRCVVGGDCADEDGRPIFVHVSSQYGWGYGFLYALTLVFMTFGLFNVIIAIYVENTVAAAKCNELKKKEERLRDKDLFREKSLELAVLAYCLKNNLDLAERPLDGVDLKDVYSMEMNQEEFSKILEHRVFIELLFELDIAEEDQSMLFDTLDVDRGGTLDINELLIGIAKLRGDPRKSDVVTVILSVRQVFHILLELEEKVKAAADHTSKKLAGIERELQRLNSSSSIPRTP